MAEKYYWGGLGITGFSCLETMYPETPKVIQNKDHIDPIVTACHKMNLRHKI